MVGEEKEGRQWEKKGTVGNCTNQGLVHHDEE
jgi:hypothetical protein